MSKIRILAIPPDNHGVGKYRIISPYTYIQENYPDDFHIDIKIDVPDDDKEFDDYDIIVLHTFIHNKVSPERNLVRIKWLREKGKIVIIDFDDHWEPDMRHPMYLQSKTSGVPKMKTDLLKACEYVTVTSAAIPSDKVRFGWLGGSSHLFDIELLRNGISSTLNTYGKKVQFVLCGFDLRGTITEINKETKEKKTRNINPEETVWFKYEKIFTNNYSVIDKDYMNFLKTYKELDYDDAEKPYIRRWTKKISQYATNYNYFDISLAPLVPSIFNTNKSQLKAIESGFFKKPIIASETEPYTLDLISAVEKGGGINPKGNALLVSPLKNHKQWAQHMKRLIDNPNMIEDLGNKLYETVHIKYSLKKVCEDRVQFLKSIIK